MTEVVLDVIPLIFKGIEGFVFDFLSRPGALDVFGREIFGSIQLDKTTGTQYLEGFQLLAALLLSKKDFNVDRESPAQLADGLLLYNIRT